MNYVWHFSDQLGLFSRHFCRFVGVVVVIVVAVVVTVSLSPCSLTKFSKVAFFSQRRYLLFQFRFTRANLNFQFLKEEKKRKRWKRNQKTIQHNGKPKKIQHSLKLGTEGNLKVKTETVGSPNMIQNLRKQSKLVSKRSTKPLNQIWPLEKYSDLLLQ